jgi:ATP-dependent helicase Lhr and Lhr-like helicase
VLDALATGGGCFFRQLSDATGSTDDSALSAAVWDLAWAGHLTNDTLAPLRARLRSGPVARRPGGTTARSRAGSQRRSSLRVPTRPSMPSRTGPPIVAGRWSLTQRRESDPTRRAHAAAESLLDRHGIVIRGAVSSEHVSGGFAAVYKVLSAFEEAGRCRRGYFVAGLGAAQFGLSGAVDRLRSLAAAPQTESDTPRALVLAATDPANPYGAALPWPERQSDSLSPGHRPGRKAGALVVLVDGMLTLYVERGGRTLLTFTTDAEQMQPAVDALALAVRDGALGRLTVERADGEAIHHSPLSDALEGAGFRATPRGLRLRA